MADTAGGTAGGYQQAEQASSTSYYPPRINETLEDSRVAPDEVSSKVLNTFEEITSSLNRLLGEFECLRHRLRTDRSLEAACIEAGLRRKLSDCLTEVQRMADVLQQKISPMQQVVAQMKRRGHHAVARCVSLSSQETQKILRLAEQLRSMCHQFSRKLHELRSITREVITLSRTRFRHTREVNIDVSPLFVIVVFLVYLWVSKQFSTVHTAFLVQG